MSLPRYDSTKFFFFFICNNKYSANAHAIFDSIYWVGRSSSTKCLLNFYIFSFINLHRLKARLNQTARKYVFCVRGLRGGPTKDNVIRSSNINICVCFFNTVPFRDSFCTTSEIFICFFTNILELGHTVFVWVTQFHNNIICL